MVIYTHIIMVFRHGSVLKRALRYIAGRVCYRTDASATLVADSRMSSRPRMTPDLTSQRVIGTRVTSLLVAAGSLSSQETEKAFCSGQHLGMDVCNADLHHSEQTLERDLGRPSTSTSDIEAGTTVGSESNDDSDKPRVVVLLDGQTDQTAPQNETVGEVGVTETPTQSHGASLSSNTEKTEKQDDAEVESYYAPGLTLDGILFSDHETNNEGTPSTQINVTSPSANDPIGKRGTDAQEQSNGDCGGAKPLSDPAPSSTESSTSTTTNGNNKSPAAATGDGSGRDIVVVTGGSGFLGQHIVKQLHERADHVSEIWIYDVKPFQQKLDYQPTKKVKYIEGNISDGQSVSQSFKGATSVIHVAGLVSWKTFPDLKGMEEVNVKGTLNVVNACIANNIRRLVYCSTVDVAIGSQPIRGGDETNTPVPDKFLFPGYPDTKYHGERIVLSAGDNSCEDGTTLQTVILRANVNYGELDVFYVTNTLRTARKYKGVLQQIGDGTAMFQQAYAGNTAWAFVCADRAMRDNPGLSQEIFYVPDNTPIQNTFNFVRPYLEARGMKLSDKGVSYPLAYGAAFLTEKIVGGLSLLFRVSLPFQSHTIAYINTDLYFCGAKAKRMLGFEPIYSPNEARVLSMKYYASVDLDQEPTS